MSKLFAWSAVFLCTTALSCWELEGFNLSEDAVQGHGIHVLRHAGAGLNRKVMSGSEAKGDDGKDEYYEKHHKIVESMKSKGGKGAYGGANVPHHGKGKNAAPSLLNPPCFPLTVTLLVIFTVILSFPALIPNLF